MNNIGFTGSAKNTNDCSNSNTQPQIKTRKGTQSFQHPINAHPLRIGIELSPQLDLHFFNTFYEGDGEQILLALEVFLEISSLDFPLLINAYHWQNWTDCRRIAHKMQPNLKMVGLTSFCQILERLEHSDLEAIQSEDMSEMFNFLTQNFDASMELVKAAKIKIEQKLPEIKEDVYCFFIPEERHNP